jgi:hypothetical protein
MMDNKTLYDRMMIHVKLTQTMGLSATKRCTHFAFKARTLRKQQTASKES